jgi:hypothetical protein
MVAFRVEMGVAQGEVIVQVNIEEFASINFGYCPALRHGRLLKEP